MRSGVRHSPRWLANLALGLMLSLALVACASGATPGGASSTRGATATAAVTAATATSALAPFVCANPPGSSAIYAYDVRNGPMYLVRGCSPSVVAPAEAGRQLAPVAFSPAGRFLLAWDSLTNQQQPDAQSCLALVEVSSGAVTPTKICSPDGPDLSSAQWYSFIGWASDASFYLAEYAPNAPMSVYFVSLPDQSKRLVTKLTWVANVANVNSPSGIALRGDALYYGGYMSQSEGGAFLHRFSLITETDTRIVRLGLAGTGGCQGTDGPCAWTGPWDISPDGSQIAYHVPGPTQSMSDTSIEAGSPLYLASSDGSGATRLFPNQAPGQGFNQPTFSPDGEYVVTTFPSSDFSQPGKVVFERLRDGALTTAPANLEWQSWTGRPGIAVMVNVITSGAPDYVTHLEIYNLATGARTPLQAGSYGYVWA